MENNEQLFESIHVTPNRGEEVLGFNIERNEWNNYRWSRTHWIVDNNGYVYLLDIAAIPLWRHLPTIPEDLKQKYGITPATIYKGQDNED